MCVCVCVCVFDVCAYAWHAHVCVSVPTIEPKSVCVEDLLCTQ